MSPRSSRKHENRGTLSLAEATRIYYPTHRVAELLNVSPSTALEMAKRGEIPGRKVGGRWKFVIAEVDAHIARLQGREAAGQRADRDEMKGLIREVLEEVLGEMAFVPVLGAKSTKGVA